jgi:hypothetical protein
MQENCCSLPPPTFSIWKVLFAMGIEKYAGLAILQGERVGCF